MRVLRYAPVQTSGLFDMKDKRGFILILTFIFMSALTLVVSALIYMTSLSTKDVGAVITDYKLLELADAGVEKAYREIRDDYLSDTQTGTSDLRGFTTSGTAGSNDSQRNRVRYYNEGSALSMDAGGEEDEEDEEAEAGTYVIVQNFDLNYLNTRITNVKLGCRYRKSSGGGETPTLELTYTTTGTFSPADPNSSVFSTQVTSSSYNPAPLTTLGATVMDITADRTWTWPVISSSNFQIRARAYDSDNRNVEVDYIFLQVTYDIDTLTEPWATGSYAAFPISLGAGTIQSISITAEQGKVHLNTASQALLRYLMVEHGVADATANTVATNIVNYRSANNFDSIEEVKQVTDMTTAIYDAIEPDITVYSFINSSAQGPAGSRAPVNINTASREALEAVFDPLTFNNASDITNLAEDIIDQRESAPFTCFYSSDSSVTTDFFDFERSLSYLSSAEDDRVLGNADASLLIPREGGNNEDALTTEFCYDANSFNVDSLAGIGGRGFRVKTLVGNDGSRTFSTYSGDLSLSGWRKENFE